MKETWLGIFLLQVALTPPVFAAFEAENGADMHMLCNLLSLETLTPEDPIETHDFSKDINEIRQMNMTTAPAAWQALFEGGKATNSWKIKSGPNKEEPMKTHWQATYDGWVADLERTTAKEAGKTWIELNPPPSGEWEKHESHKIINRTLRYLIEANTEMVALQEKVRSTKPQEAAALLSEAFYGEGNKDGKPTKANTINGAGGYASGCATNGGKSILGDLMCVCGSTAPGGTQDCTGTNVNLAGDSDMSTKFEAAKQLCKEKPAGRLTESRIRAAEQSAKQAIRTSENGGSQIKHLGKISGAGCTGAAGQQCVIYTNYLAGDSTAKSVANIPWIKKLEAAAAALEDRDLTQAKASSKAVEVKTLIAQAKQAYLAGTRPINHSQTVTNHNTKIQKEDCTKHTTNDTCTQNNCKWNSTTYTTGSHCKPKNGEEQKTQGTDGAAGTNAEGKKCSDKKKDDCKSPNCKWDRRKMQSSSFLVNNKLTLSMAAIFMSLV
uniref:Variant surface glycoprotein 521 n=1 Tax=Trypanosoma brucei TaxID=5691 RepID=M4TDE8_9TRYP|nr:variant surface glycoprotein 521 [Trypanosoma brucei]